MLTQCPECGSNDIITDLCVFTGDAPAAQDPVYVSLMEPEPIKRPFIWMPKSVISGFFAAVCGTCGYTRLYTRRHAELLEAHRNGYASETYRLNRVPFQPKMD